MSRLVDFYRGDTTDSAGRLLTEIWAWADDDLEMVHDFIQWLFPLPEPSRFNADAPLLSAADIAAFKSDPLLQANLRKSFERILAFLGLACAEEGKVVEGKNFARRAPEVWSAPNHNWLRVTRILRSLTLLGSAAQARVLYAWLDGAYASRRFPITGDTYRYWTEAI